MNGVLDVVVDLYGTELGGNLGGTLLHPAAWLGRPDLVRRLLELGADAHARADTEWATPLGWAVGGSRYAVDEPAASVAAHAPNHVATAELLQAAGANVTG